MNSKSPLIVVVLNLIVGYLVAKGLIDAASQEQLISLLADAIAAIAYAATAIYGIYKFFDSHKHHVTKEVELKRGTPVIDQTKVLDAPDPESEK